MTWRRVDSLAPLLLAALVFSCTAISDPPGPGGQCVDDSDCKAGGICSVDHTCRTLTTSAMPSAGAPPFNAAGEPAPIASAGTAAHAGLGASTSAVAGEAPSAGKAGAQNPRGDAGAIAGSSGSSGSAGSFAGAAGAAGSKTSADAGTPDGGAPMGEINPTAVCTGGTPGMDSDAVTTTGQTSSRNFALVQYLVAAPNKISRFQTILVVPKRPTQSSALFIWPGLQHSGGADPGGVGNGVLQSTLTWGPSCNPHAPDKGNDYLGWWISAMYVNLSSTVAGPGGCQGGTAMDLTPGVRLHIDFTVMGSEWTQSILNLTTKSRVNFAVDLKGQDQNWAIWDIETPGSARPAEDTVFEKSVLTFASPIGSCQPTSASEIDYFSVPIRSPDGLNCCFEKMILKANRQ